MSGAVDVFERIVPHLPESVDRVERRLRVASQRVSRVYVPALLVQIIGEIPSSIPPILSLSLASIASFESLAHRSAWTRARVAPGLSCDTFAQELWALPLMVLGTARVLNASG